MSVHEDKDIVSVEISFNTGEAFHVRFAGAGMETENEAVQLVMQMLCLHIGSDGMDISPLVIDLYDITKENSWLKRFSEIGPEGRKEFAQYFGFIYIDCGQDNYVGRDEYYKVAIGREEEEKKNMEAQAKMGAHRFMVEYNRGIIRHAKLVEANSPEWWAQNALRIEHKDLSPLSW